eukprot:6173123-Alexandrium_andersonii.AAC.1
MLAFADQGHDGRGRLPPHWTHHGISDPLVIPRAAGRAGAASSCSKSQAGRASKATGTPSTVKRAAAML